MNKVPADFMKNTGSRKTTDKKVVVLWQSLKSAVRLSTSVDSEGKSGKLITAIMRPSKRPSGKEIVSILKRIVKKIRLAWPDIGIMIRSDSHYGMPVVYDFCEGEDLKYVFGLALRYPMWEETEKLRDEAEKFYPSPSGCIQCS